MGSYTSIGLVYSDGDILNMNRDLPSVTSCLSNVCDKIVLHYPVDDSYERWVEEVFEGEDGLIEAFTILNAKEMSTGKMHCKIRKNQYTVLASIRGTDAPVKGFLFEVPEEELLHNDVSIKNLNDVTIRIIDSIMELWNRTAFSYAFCDSEADIEYTISELMDREKPVYSVLLSKDALGHPTVQFGSWCIDGLTQREAR